MRRGLQRHAETGQREKSKVIALGWSVWWIKNWLCSLCGGAKWWELFQNSLTMGLCALRRKCSARKRRSSESSDPSACRASANSTCLPISARPWLHRGAISRSSAMTVNQKPAEWQKNVRSINFRVAWAANDYVSTSRASELVADGSKNAKLLVQWLRSRDPWTRSSLGKRLTIKITRTKNCFAYVFGWMTVRNRFRRQVNRSRCLNRTLMPFTPKTWQSWWALNERFRSIMLDHLPPTQRRLIAN